MYIYVYVYIHIYHASTTRCGTEPLPYAHHQRVAKRLFQRFVGPVYDWKTAEKHETDHRFLGSSMCEQLSFLRMDYST
jgi:hypothetical protein